MGRRDSSSKRKREKISSMKKSRRKDQKKRRICDSDTTNSGDDLFHSGHSSFPSSKSDHRRKINGKKKGRRDSSSSSDSDYESLSSDSDSGNAYKSRKARRSQVGLKDTKRRGRKRSASPNGDVVRRKKRLDRDRIVKPIKKISKKKLSKYSSSSSSSDSESHSICQSESSGSTTDGLRRRIRSRGSHKAKKMHKERTPSSLCDRGIEPSISLGNNDEALFPSDNSRRLRSVIVVVNQSHDELEHRWEVEPHREGIAYEQNDCPSLGVAHRNRICAENVALGDHQLKEAQMIDTGKKKEIDVSVPEAASGGEILESILRQKALERLRKFKQSLQTGPTSTTVKMNDESHVGRDDVDQNKLIKEGSTNTREMSKTSALSSKGEFLLTEDEDKKLPDSGHFEKDPGMVKQHFAHPPKEVKTLVECSEEDKRVNASISSIMEPSSSVGPVSGEYSIERGNEAKDGSHFQQKTMSVMRGGEQVQVSYKVYIPQKAPALARRQLRR